MGPRFPHARTDGLLDVDDMDSLRTLAETTCECRHAASVHLAPELSSNRVTGCLICDCPAYTASARPPLAAPKNTSESSAGVPE